MLLIFAKSFGSLVSLELTLDLNTCTVTRTMNLREDGADIIYNGPITLQNATLLQLSQLDVELTIVDNIDRGHNL
jgi:hypothetical protein